METTSVNKVLIAETLLYKDTLIIGQAINMKPDKNNKKISNN
jgi:hypothetical protein